MIKNWWKCLLKTNHLIKGKEKHWSCLCCGKVMTELTNFSYTFCLWCYLAFRVLRRVQVDCPCITQLLVCRRVLNCFVNYIEIVNLYIGFQSIISTPPCSNLSFSTHSIIGTSPFHRVVFFTIDKYFSEEIKKIGVTKINSYFSVKTSSFSCRLDKDFLV